MPTPQHQLQKWFVHHIKDSGQPYRLDKHQARVILDQHQNCLVTARAGSGKTRTVVAKIVYLIANRGIKPSGIIVFAFNRKAKTEINQRLTQITFDGRPIFTKTPSIATTFHAYAFHLLQSYSVPFRLAEEKFNLEQISNFVHKLYPNLTTTELERTITEVTQFITCAEQKYFDDYSALKVQIDQIPDPEQRSYLANYYQILQRYHQKLSQKHLLNFNQLVMQASIVQKQKPIPPYKYIFIDEYQDFSKLFFSLIHSIRLCCPHSNLLAVGDDWQAINGFAGSELCYFQNFEHYFPENCANLFIPTNYRSGRRIVRNANYFMATAINDYKSCRSGNKTSSHIHLVNLKTLNLPPKYYSQNRPLLIQKMLFLTLSIILRHPGKSIKILSRNNVLSLRDWSLERFTELVQASLPTKLAEQSPITATTIHRSKGLEADIVILLEIDQGKFPKPSKNQLSHQLFQDDQTDEFSEEKRLFYVALTRAKQDLYIFTTTPPTSKHPTPLNFLSYLNPNWLEDYVP